MCQQLCRDCENAHDYLFEYTIGTKYHALSQIGLVESVFLGFQPSPKAIEFLNVQLISTEHDICPVL